MRVRLKNLLPPRSSRVYTYTTTYIRAIGITIDVFIRNLSEVLARTDLYIALVYNFI